MTYNIITIHITSKAFWESDIAYRILLHVVQSTDKNWLHLILFSFTYLFIVVFIHVYLLIGRALFPDTLFVITLWTSMGNLIDFMHDNGQFYSQKINMCSIILSGIACSCFTVLFFRTLLFLISVIFMWLRFWWHCFC